MSGPLGLGMRPSADAAMFCQALNRRKFQRKYSRLNLGYQSTALSLRRDGVSGGGVGDRSGDANLRQRNITHS
ncbi:MAG: hypothetical protein AAFQ75_11190, partial [Pseudomonadota bacterium]